MAVTIQQIAERAGVSRGTVDRALNNRGRINPEVAEMIKKTAEEMGYVHKTRKKQKNAGGKKKIGIITQLSGAAFMVEVKRGIFTVKKELEELGAQAPKATERINTENRNIQASKKDNKPSEREVRMMNNYKKNTRSLLIVSAALAAAVIIEFIVILMFVLGSENDGNIEMTDNSNIAATETDNGNNEFLQPKITQDTTAEEVTTEEYTEETTEKETNGIFKNDKKDEMDFMNETEPESGNTKELFTDSDF